MPSEGQWRQRKPSDSAGEWGKGIQGRLCGTSHGQSDRQGTKALRQDYHTTSRRARLHLWMPQGLDCFQTSFMPQANQPCFPSLRVESESCSPAPPGSPPLQGPGTVACVLQHGIRAVRPSFRNTGQQSWEVQILLPGVPKGRPDRPGLGKCS